MPRCSSRLAQSLRETDLPILPWLAPRDFQPWPFPRHRQSRDYSILRCDGHSTPRCQQDEQSRYRYRALESPFRPPPAHHGRRSYSRALPTRSDSSRGYSRSQSNRPALNEEHSASARSKHIQQWYQDIHGIDSKQGQASADSEAETSQEKSPVNTERDELGWELRGHERPYGMTRAMASRLGLDNRKPSTRGSTSDKLYTDLREEKRNIESSMTKHRGRSGPHDKFGFSKTRAKFVAVGRPLRKQDSAVPIDKTLGTASKEEGKRRGRKSEKEEESLSFAADDFSGAWNLNYSRLNTRFDKKTDPTYSVHRDKDLLLHPEAGTWAEAILSAKTDRITQSAVLRAARAKAREAVSWNRLWTHAMLWTLRNKPNEGTRFLALTHIPPFVSRTWIEDSVAYLARHFAAFSNADGVIELAETLVSLMERPGAPSLQLRESQVRLLLPRLSLDQTLQLLAVIKTNHVYVHGQTFLHIASHLAHLGNLRESMECLLEAPEFGIRIDDKAFMSVCATILRRTSDQPEGLRICLSIIQNLVKIGVRINVQLCNIVILNAVEAGDLSTAFSVYHSLVDHGLQADAYTYAIILKGCKKAFKDTETLHATIQSTVHGTDLTKEPIVAAEVLHCLYLFHFGTNPSSAWSNISLAYRQMFDTKPLEALGILTPTTWRATTQDLSQPSTAAIGIMLSAWLRTMSRNPDQHLEVYGKFRTLARSGEAPYAEMARTDHIFNLFLKVFCDKKTGLPYAADVIRDMQSSNGPRPPTQSPEQLDSNHSEESESLDGARNNPFDSSSKPPPSFCKPTVRSWSILLKGFTKAKKMELAEQVLAYMRDQGIEPNLVTWNSLFDGYAGLRNPEGALTAYKRMEKAGLTADEYTETSARKISLSIADLDRENQREEAVWEVENQWAEADVERDNQREEN